MFCRIQNLHISQTTGAKKTTTILFCRIQNLHISQTLSEVYWNSVLFCRIQNLHISQTELTSSNISKSFVEFKIYISLKHGQDCLIRFYVL